MALTAQTSQRELARIAALAYEGRTIRVSLASMTTQGLTSESNTTAWDAVKLSGNGYADFTVATLGTGAYDSTTDLRYELPVINAVFTANSNGVGFTATHYYVVCSTSGTNDPNICQLGTFSPAQVWAPGQSQTVQITLVVDD